MGKRNMLQNDKLHGVEIKRKEVEKKYEYRGIRTLIKKGHYDLAIVVIYVVLMTRIRVLSLFAKQNLENIVKTILHVLVMILSKQLAMMKK